MRGPVGDLVPLRVAVERAERLVERVGVDQRPATHPGTGQHEDVAQQVNDFAVLPGDERDQLVLVGVNGIRLTTWDETDWKIGPLEPNELK